MNARLQFQDEWQRFTPVGWESESDGLVIVEGHIEPLGLGPMLPEPDPTLFDDDKHSYLRDEWRAEERQWREEL